MGCWVPATLTVFRVVNPARSGQARVWLTRGGFKEVIHGRHVREERINSRQRTELAIRWQQPAQPQFVTPERHLDGRSYGVHFWLVKRGAKLHTQLTPPQATNPPTPSLPLLTYHWLGRGYTPPARLCMLQTSVGIQSGRLW